MICCRRILLFLFSTAFLTLDAQQLITSYSVEEGLPQSTVMALYRDDDGYLWCGTGSGLALYDGWEFHTPVSDAEKPDPNLNSPVRGIIASSDQKSIWVGTETLIMQYDRYTYKVLRSFDILKRPSIAEVPVMANDTAVWVLGWANGLYRVRISDGRITQLTFDSFQDQFGISADHSVVVFPDSTHNFNIYNLLTNKSLKVKRPAELEGVKIGMFMSKPGTTDELVFASETGLWQVNLSTGVIDRFFLGDAEFDNGKMNIVSLASNADGSWWIACYDVGLFRYDPIQKTIRPCLWQQDGIYAGDLLRKPKGVVCDAYGVVWLATDGNGVVKVLHNRVTFRSKFTSNVITDTCNWFIRSFYELSPGRYLVGTYRSGIQLIDETANVVKHITADPIWNQQTPFFITASGDGRLLVGTERYLFLLDTTTWEEQTVNTKRGQYDQKFIGCLHLQSGQILVYGSCGLMELQLGDNPTLSGPLGTVSNNTSAIQLSDGRILVGTYNEGIQELTPDLKFVKFYPYDSHIGVSTSTVIHGMYEDESHNLWFGSASGLHKLNSQFRLLQTWNMQDGFPDQTIYDLTGYGENSLIVATGHGVVIMDRENGIKEVFGAVDGLPSEECNTGALLVGKSGELYVGTTEGFVHWNPNVTIRCFRSAMVLASFEGSDPFQTGVVREPIVRDYGFGSLELRIWLTDFAFPELATYTYQLDGANTGKTVERGLRKVTYAALGSGLYSFLCSVNVPGCGETKIEKLFTIKIVPPFWMSGWFIVVSSLGAVLIITLALFIIMRMNYQRKLRNMKMQQALDKVRARISRDIHDEIGAGLTRIALSGELMSQKVETDAAQQEKLKWIAGTARELSQSMKEVVWSVNPHYDSLDHMVAYFRSYVAGVAENSDVRFKFAADENLPAVGVNPETRRNLLLILKESISNSVKYSQCTELKLEIYWKSQMFTMKISDNGKGFDVHGREGVNSNGIRNIKQRAQASKCTATFESVPAGGTTITISGPIL